MPDLEIIRKSSVLSSFIDVRLVGNQVLISDLHSCA